MHAALKSWIAAATLSFATVSMAAPTYWSVFNIEGESDVDAAIVTYATRTDMLNDENRTGLHIPDGSGTFGANIVDSGSDGTTYWNLFNIEGESDVKAAFVTYATLADMLNDENRTGLFIADGNGIFGANIVGSGFDGSTYWNVFNIEGESDVAAAIVTYATLADMLNDENRTGLSIADGSGFFGVNIVGSGYAFDTVSSVPEPESGWLVLLALGALHLARRAPKRSTESI